jgi:hypothetical protein
LAVTWIQNFSDNFIRPTNNNSLTGTNNALVQNNWVDRVLGVGDGSGEKDSLGGCSFCYSINLGAIGLQVNNTSSTINNQLTRPAQESPTVNERAIITTEPAASGSRNYAVALRVQPVGDDYYCNLLTSTSTNNLTLHSIVGTTDTTLFTGSIAITTGDIYTVDCSTVGASPTVLTVTATDITAMGTPVTVTGSDSTTGLQVPGLLGITNRGGFSGIEITNFVDYSDQVASIEPTPITIFCFGDSITYGSGTTITIACQAACNRVAAYIAPRPVYCGDIGGPGTVTNQWTPGNNNYNSLVALLQIYNFNTQLFILEMLGTNDAGVPGSFTSAATWKSHFISINAGLISNFPQAQIQLDCPLFVNYVAEGTGNYTSATNPLIQAYCAAAPSVAAAAPNSVYVGDTLAYNAWSGPNSRYFTSPSVNPGLHPGDIGAPVLGGLWADAVLKRLGAVGGYYFLY